MRINTDRLLLRDFLATDWAETLAYQRDPLYLRFYLWTDRTEAEVKDFIQGFINQQNERPRRKFQLAIVLRESSKLIGNCGIRLNQGNDREADIGFELSPEFWGRGFATEAGNAMVEFGFSELKLHRISSWCIADNAASGRVLEKLGLRLEGRLRQNEHFKSRWWDTLLYGMFAQDWRASGNLR